MANDGEILLVVLVVQYRVFVSCLCIQYSPCISSTCIALLILCLRRRRRLRSCVVCRAIAVYHTMDVIHDPIVAAISDLQDGNDTTAIAPVYFVELY